jgi:hypothetical protein
VEVVRVLLAWGAHADEEALLWAVDNGHQSAVEVLLEADARRGQAHTRGEMGSHLLWCAVQHGASHHGIVRLLMNAGASLLDTLS